MNGPTRSRRVDHDALQARVALRVAVVQRPLRVAREQAVARARQLRLTQPATATATAKAFQVSQGSVALGQPPSGWLRLASVLPLILLVLGLVMIQHLHDQAEIHAAAEVDAALLADDLPPEAYGDPGFVIFLKQPEQ